MKTVVGILYTLFFCLCCHAGPDEPAKPAVTLFPQEAYLNEPVAFSFPSKPGEVLEIRLNAKKLDAVKFEKNELELNLTLAESGVLSFQTGRKAAKFQLVLPEDEVELVERDGFIYARDLPAILLVRHRHPPKHDRRWEVVKLLNGMIHDTRPAVESGAVFAGDEVSYEDLAAMDKASSSTKSTWEAAGKGDHIYEVNRIITSKPPKTDVVLFVLTGRDLKRGMAMLRYRMRTEWILQRQKDSKHLYLLSMPLGKELLRNFPDANQNMSLAARANGAVLISSARKSKQTDQLVDAAAKIASEVRFK